MYFSFLKNFINYDVQIRTHVANKNEIVFRFRCKNVTQEKSKRFSPVVSEFGSSVSLKYVRFILADKNFTRADTLWHLNFLQIKLY